MKDFIVSEKLSAQIADYQNRPLAVGDSVVIDKNDILMHTGQSFGGVSRTPNELVWYNVLEILPDNQISITLDKGEWGAGKEKKSVVVPQSIIKEKNNFFIGENPMKKVMPEINYYNVDIWQLLSRAGYDLDGEKMKDRIDSEENFFTWNPFLLDKNGVKVYYQRGFVWSLEEKQLLIESIYNEVSIGTFIFRYRGWKEGENLKKLGHLDFGRYEIVDGKQRLNAILSFIRGDFPDFEGRYFGDFSERAKRDFSSYRRLSYGELAENTPDNQVKVVFLNINHAGVPMSKEHLNFIKSINI